MALTVQGKPLGFLEVYSFGEIRDFTNWHRQLFKTFVEQASLALGNVTSRIQLKQLNQITSKMADCRKVEDVLVELQQGGLSLANCPKGWVSQLDYKTGEREILKYSGPQPKSLRLGPGEGITGKALREDKPQRAGDVHSTVRALEHEEQGILDRVFHELKAPIVGIKNTTRVLQHRWQTLSEDTVRKKFDDISIDCDILLHQAWQLQHALDHRPVSVKKQWTLVMRDIVIKTINQLRPLVRERELDPSFMRYHNHDIAKIDIYVDREKLNQIVYNLLMNAIKYAKDAPAEFNITVTADGTVENFVLKFIDWGIGIPPGCEEKIFKRGFRTSEARRKNVAGSGLGLTIARELAREIGGDLRLTHRAEPTEFALILPKTLQEPTNGKENTETDNPLRR
jgi:signal transduction histidine kinase